MEQKRKSTISIVIPAFNEERYLPRTLASIASQTVLPLEVLVADNNSTDKTSSLAKQAGTRVISVTQQGYVYALRAGMDQTKGTIIAVVDADTIIFPNWIESIEKVFATSSVVGATGIIRIKDRNLLSGISDFFYTLFLQLNFWIGKPHLVGFNFAVRKDALDKVGGLNTTYTMSPDVELGLRLKSVGRVVFARSMVVHPSMRRWDKNFFQTFYEYAKSYITTVWLHRPPGVKQSVIR